MGYNPWGIYTYPSLTGEGPGSVSFDVKAAGECGYNMIRMHIKDNEPEWYAACDREGVLVWDEVPSCFYGTWKDPLWRGLHLRRLKAMARKQNYHSSVVMCSVFNESWGILGDHERSPWDNDEARTGFVLRHRHIDGWRQEFWWWIIRVMERRGDGYSGLSQLSDRICGCNGLF